MYLKLEKQKENKSKTIVNSVTQKKNNEEQGLNLVDNRSKILIQKKQQKVPNGNIQMKSQNKEVIQNVSTSQPIQRISLLPVLGGISMTALMAMMKYDSHVRQKNYTDKIKNIPGVASEIFAGASKAKQAGQKIDPNLHKIVTEGAIEARNRQMEDTRQKISPLGLLLSVFMKKQGLTMGALKHKYKTRYPKKNDEQIFKLIIDSAGRSNPSLGQKFLKSLLPKSRL